MTDVNSPKENKINKQQIFLAAKRVLINKGVFKPKFTTFL